MSHQCTVMIEPIIRFEHIHKAFGELLVLDDLSLDIETGKTTVIMGPSGTGKSVFLKLLVGLLEPDEGRIFVTGEEVTGAREKDLRRIRMRLGMMFQEGALFDSMTVYENISFPLRRHTRMKEPEMREVVAERLERVGLPGTEGMLPSELSGGMRRRVGLARAIVLDPQIVLFDEPTSGLDPVTSDSVDELIAEMKAAMGITFVVISHDIVGSFRIADRIGMLNNGRLIALGTPEEVKRNPDPFVRQFLSRNLALPPLEQPLATEQP